MFDLDIMVMPDEAERAVAALGTIGYEIHDQARLKSGRWCIELSRPRDVGTVDLHRAAPGPRTSIRSCPRAWCSWCVTCFTGRSRVGQLAIAGRLTVGSSLKGAMVSSVM
jgi:hypothetical protein